MRIDRTTSYLIIIALAYTLLTWVLLFVLPLPLIVNGLAVEDGVVETFTALSFFMAGLTFLIAFIRSKKGNNFLGIHTPRNVILLVIAAGLIFGAGEEISWGQRILGFQTPEEIVEINKQKEFNLHNLEGVNLTMLFNLFWLTFAVFVPVLARVSPQLRKWFLTLGMPVVPLELGSLVLFQYFLYKLSYAMGIKDDEIYGGGITEIYESQIAFALFLIAIWCYVDAMKPAKSDDTIVISSGSNLIETKTDTAMRTASR
jgi:hypothetical protein